MKFTNHFLDDIRARLPVSEVVGARVKLRRQGREWVGLSPFNAEKTPSFTVNDQKGFFHDFSSGKTGDIFGFVMATEGLEFPEAVEKLAQMAGVPLPATTPEDEAQERRRADLYQVMTLAAEFFQAQLQTKTGAKARGYLSGRGLTPALCEAFQIGYAPNERFALRDFLAGKNVSADSMIAAGLLIHGDDIAVPYDRFRGRVMFPIADRAGRIIAFGGRALEADVPAKYLNSPETVLFHKGAQLFNHHRARAAAHDKGTVIVVEGYVDAIMVSQAGFPHVVAPLGTALTQDQCQLLWRMTPEPILCFDGDKAGRKAASRAIDLVMPMLAPERSLRFAFLPEGRDPDELIRTEGNEAFAACLTAAKPLVEVAFARAYGETPLETPEQRAAFEKRLMALCQDIQDISLRRHYETAFKERLAAIFGAGFGSVQRQAYGQTAGGAAPRGQGFQGAGGWQNRYAGGRAFPSSNQRYGAGAMQASKLGFASSPLAPSPLLGTTALMQTKALWPPREAFILAMVMYHPALFLKYDATFAALEFSGLHAQKFYQALLGLSLDDFASTEGLRERLKASGQSALLQELDALPILAGFAQKFLPDMDFGEIEKNFLQAITLQRRKTDLTKELNFVKAELANEPSEQNLAKLQDLLLNFNDLDAISASEDRF